MSDSIKAMINSLINGEKDKAAESLHSHLTAAVKDKITEGKSSPSYTFKKVSSYEEFERLGSGTQDYDEDSVDGKRVVAVYKGDNVVGLWYTKAKVGSSCPQFKGDLVSYSEQDTNWPCGD